ncbi:hypothetical protein BUALT_Bualt04G0177400 [Buddleja alternifolia]|uniref:Inactive shikimate kinase like 1, chloroplastic n=1 Tax=Buddleja alternifolia TaxID=168488 RepID=A0AAV6XY28_9LAMI|nr:hypothetical protein BUALT_Bualt04G0177400 [Buddleja alternifolia]
MKSPLGKLRKFALNKSEPKENWDQHISDMKDMRTCYDGLLSAAAATANSAYEFSESLLEMGNCLMEKTAMHDNGESGFPFTANFLESKLTAIMFSYYAGGALSMLGKVQLELQKLVDSYEMKLQCDEKREMFEYMVGQFREKGKSRHGKGETFTPQQLQAVSEEYDDAARLCVFRVESLKQGQSRSLLTQAARHHAAQLNFFRKGLQSLEAVEPHIKNVADKQHIDYELYELIEGGEGDGEGYSFETNNDGELSFDYRQNKLEPDNASALRNTMEVDPLGTVSTQASKIKDVDIQINIGKNQDEQILSQQRRVASHSAPIYAEKFDPSDRIREMRTAVQKLNTHVLPTPDDARGSIASNPTPPSSTLLPTGSSKNLWHSSPLDIEKQKKMIDDHLSVRNSSKSQIAVEDNSKNKHFLPLPRPQAGGAAVPQFDTQSGFDTQKIKRQAFSGPLASNPSSNKPLLHTSGPISSTELPQSNSGLLTRVSGPQLPSSLNVSNNASPSLVSSPKISELHELPRPPDSLVSKPRRSMGALGHSAPLGNINHREVSPTNRVRQSKEGSPLPLPQLTVSRSFSIPSSSQRAMALHSGKLLECSQVVQKAEDIASPPLTPISLSNMKSPNSGQIRALVDYAPIWVLCVVLYISLFPCGEEMEGVESYDAVDSVGTKIVEDEQSLAIKKKASEISPDLRGTSIFLIGINSAYKSSLGRTLADALRYYYFDSDSLVEEAAGGKAAAVSYIDGNAEEYLVSETEVLKQLSSMGRLVVSAGNGAVKSATNLALLRHGISIWIDVPLDLVARDIVEDRIQLSASDTSVCRSSEVLDQLTTLYNSARSGYSTADATISLQKVASQLGYDELDAVTTEDLCMEVLKEIERLVRVKKMMEEAARPF